MTFVAIGALRVNCIYAAFIDDTCTSALKFENTQLVEEVVVVEDMSRDM